MLPLVILAAGGSNGLGPGGVRGEAWAVGAPPGLVEGLLRGRLGRTTAGEDGRIMAAAGNITRLNVTQKLSEHSSQ